MESGIQDGIDQAILQLLHDDGRRTYESIGEEIGVTASEVESRVQRLRDEGTITKFTVLTDPTRMGYITAAFGVTTEPTATDAIAEELGNHPNVFNAWILSGRHSVVTHASFRDIEAFQRFTNETLNGLDGIVQYESSIVTRSVLSEGSVVISEPSTTT